MMIHDAVIDARARIATPPQTALWTVQAMRAAAALMVVIGHSQTAIATSGLSDDAAVARWTFLPWGAGVDLFFVISGFIMVYASHGLFGGPGAARTFLWRRIVRIVPLYWAATALYLALLGAATIKGGDPFPNLAAIAASLAFVPWRYGGGVFPVFDLGWTLNYEMFFYLLFAIVLTLPRRAAVPVLVAMLALLVIAGAGGIDPRLAQPFFWTRAIMLDFGLGAAVAMIHAENVTLPAVLRLGLVAAGVAILMLDPAHLFNGPPGTTVANDWPRVAFAGMPAAMILAGAVLGPAPAAGPIAQPVTRLGDASYSLYLLHPFALIVIEKLVQKSAAVRAAPPWLLVAAAVIAAIVLALLAFRYFERPVTNHLRNLARVRGSAGSAVRFRDWVAP